MDKYIYLLLSVGFLVPALGVLWYRWDLRKPLMVLGLVGGLLALATEAMYYADYWRPYTTSGHIVSVEDFIFGWSMAVLAAGCYDVFFRTKPVRIRRNRLRELAVLVVLGLSFVLVLAIFFRVNSMVATLIGLAIFTAYFLFRQPKLYKRSAVSALTMVGILFIVYVPLFTWLASTNYISEVFLLTDKPYNPTIFGAVPIFELYWYGLWGALQGMVLGFVYTYSEE